MDQVACLPFSGVQFSKNGTTVDAGEIDRAEEMVTSGTSDLIVFSHGWNNDMREASDLYQRFFEHFCRQSGGAALGDSRFAVLGAYWPSKRFAETEQIPGGAASVRQGFHGGTLVEAVAQLRDILDEDDLVRAEKLLKQVEDSPSARSELTEMLADYLESLDTESEDDPPDLRALGEEQVFRELEKPRLAVRREPLVNGVRTTKAEPPGSSAAVQPEQHSTSSTSSPTTRCVTGPE